MVVYRKCVLENNGNTCFVFQTKMIRGFIVYHFFFCFLFVNHYKVRINVDYNKFLSFPSTSSPSFMNAQSLTEQILELRKRTDAFKESIRTRSEKMNYTFYDGPPFTSGDPHYGHLLQSIVKDMVPRRMTMRGYRVNRKR
ncbi:class I tRNA ligase family protein [Patescibacteria group bacterium]|nr:class I tRNA ligase family protein [Patescibacteria group bacterium]